MLGPTIKKWVHVTLTTAIDGYFVILRLTLDIFYLQYKI